jgi:hypothetical protein
MQGVREDRLRPAKGRYDCQPAEPKAYSYQSSSTPEQAKDGSQGRPTEQGEAWAMPQCVVAPQSREHINALMATARMSAVLDEKPMPLAQEEGIQGLSGSIASDSDLGLPPSGRNAEHGRNASLRPCGQE